MSVFVVHVQWWSGVTASVMPVAFVERSSAQALADWCNAMLADEVRAEVQPLLLAEGARALPLVFEESGDVAA